MNKVSVVVAVVIGVFVSANVFARADENLQDIKNWTPFFTEGKTLSYEYEDGDPHSAKKLTYT